MAVIRRSDFYPFILNFTFLLENFRHKFQLSFRLLVDIFRLFPERLYRWFRHWSRIPVYLREPVLYGIHLSQGGRLSLWLGEWLFLLLDIMGLPEWYELGNSWIKFGSRPLNAQEKSLARFIFGPTIPLYRIQLDERARVGPRQYHFCYVSFCVINSWEEMPPAILVHELVHVWQFQRFGSVYILRALLAQRTPRGYDYGGIGPLDDARQQGVALRPFNYEQQASIIEDYFRLHRTGFARYGSQGAVKQLDIYQYFVDSLQKQRTDYF